MSRASWLKAFALAAALLGFAGVGTAKAQDWTDYLHWPYVPPQIPGNGFEYNAALRQVLPLSPRAADRPADPGPLLPQLLRRLPRPRHSATRTAGTTGTRRSSTRATTSSSTSSELGRSPDPRLAWDARRARRVAAGPFVDLPATGSRPRPSRYRPGAGRSGNRPRPPAGPGRARSTRPWCGPGRCRRGRRRGRAARSRRAGRRRCRRGRP